jgi:hypothetical protein
MAVEELFFAPAGNNQQLNLRRTCGQLLSFVKITDLAPVIRALCDRVAGRRRRLFGVPASGGVSTSAALIMASKLELVGADIEALLILY